MSFEFSDLERRVAMLIRYGTVAEADYAAARVRVAMGAAVTDWLPWITLRAGNDRTWWAPEVGEQVLLLSPSGDTGQGVVLGSIFQAAHSGPAAAPTMDRRVYTDGAVIEYDREAHRLHALIPGEAVLEASGGVNVWAGGEVKVESRTKVRLAAPDIELAGQVAIDGPMSMGGAGGQSLPVTINGSVTHRGGNFISEMDVVADGVSLKSHQHELYPSPAIPTGGVADIGGLAGWSEAAVEQLEARAQDGCGELFDALRMALDGCSYATDKDKLLLCIPDIAEAEASRAGTAQDSQGWLYLAAFLRKWFAGKASDDKTARPPSFVEWDWLLSFSRAEVAWQNLMNPMLLFSGNARAALAGYLDADGLLSEEGGTFDYTGLSWETMHSRQFQFVVVPEYPLADGLTASIGAFGLYALAKGYVEPAGERWRIAVTGVSFYLRDNFDFEGEQALGHFDCEKREFEDALSVVAPNIANSDFREFRSRHGKGGDFYVLASPREVDGFVEYIYET